MSFVRRSSRPYTVEDTYQRDALREKSDEEILALSLRMPDCFEIIIDRYREAFLRKARAILGEGEASADVVQDTFVKIYVHARKFTPREGASFKSWAYKILVNSCFTVYKKRKREREFTVEMDPELAELVPSKAEALDLEHRLDTDFLVSFISRLPDLLGRSVRLHFLEGKPQKEIAAIEGTSVGAIRARIHRAKKELKKMKLNLI